VIEGGNVFRFCPKHPKVWLMSVEEMLSVAQRELYALDLKSNNEYQITVSLYFECLEVGLNLSYYQGSIQIIPSNITQGGLRISKIINQASSTAPPEIKRIYYSQKDNLNQSSGIQGITPWYITPRTDRLACEVQCDYYDVTYSVLNSSSVRNLFDSRGQSNTTYRFVTISHGGDNYEKGGEELEYYINQDNLGSLIRGNNNIEGAPMDNWGWDNGLLKTHLTFTNDGNLYKPINEKNNTYQRDSRIDTYVYGFTIKKNFDLLCTYPQPDYRNLEGMDIMLCRLRTNWHYLNNVVEKQYDLNGENPVTTTINYFYDNPEHLQLTRTETSDSQGNIIQTKTSFPNDINSASDLGYDILDGSELEHLNTLKAQHRIAIPIQTETFRNGVSTSAQRTNFSGFGDGIIEPVTIQTSKAGFDLENRIIYHNYDGKGNPLEVSKADGTHIVYIWGYNQTQPIAKIENATYNEVSSYVANLQTLSNNDIDRTINTNGTEGALRSALDALRTTFPNAQVTTFTYDPLIGVTSVTDPRGYTMYYAYDSFNRLEYIIDDDGNYINKYEYHYKNQQ